MQAMSETEQAQIEALRRREDAGEALSLPEAAQLAAFYAQVEAAEEARLAPRREAEREKRRRYLAELEAILTQKRESLQRLELLVREIETLDQKESRLRATVQG